MDRGNLGGPPTSTAGSYNVNSGRGHGRIQVNEILPASVSNRGSIDNLHPSLGLKENQISKANMDGKISLKISQEISECNNAWMLYLQGLAGLCSAGARVSHSLQVLSHGLPIGATAGHCRSVWDELLRATQTASQSVRAEVTLGLRELASDEQKSTRTAEQIVSSSLATLINLQYQFCVACCDCLANIGTQDASPQQQVSPSGDGCVNRQQHQLFTRLLGGQRRWSEVAARRTTEHGEEGDDSGAPRRWSVPWEGPGAGGGGSGQHQLAVPLVAHERSSRSTTPDSASLASQEELQEVISLLSCRPAHQLQPSSRQLPGVTLTSYSHPDTRDTWPQGVPLFPRDANSGGWYHGIADAAQPGETTSGSRRGGSPRPVHHHRSRGGWTPHEPLYTTIWGEHEGENATGHVDNHTDSCSSYQQRKSSSSTDSSSSSSLPQQQQQQQQNNLTSEQQHPSHLYSMWSGSEVAPVLPFIQLPTSPGHAPQDTPGNMLP